VAGLLAAGVAAAGSLAAEVAAAAGSVASGSVAAWLAWLARAAADPGERAACAKSPRPNGRPHQGHYKLGLQSISLSLVATLRKIASNGERQHHQRATIARKITGSDISHIMRAGIRQLLHDAQRRPSVFLRVDYGVCCLNRAGDDVGAVLNQHLDDADWKNAAVLIAALHCPVGSIQQVSEGSLPLFFEQTLGQFAPSFIGCHAGSSFWSVTLV
jgi:hypothetical protein